MMTAQIHCMFYSGPDIIGALCGGDRQGESYLVQRVFVMNCNEQCCPFDIEINEDFNAWDSMVF